MNLMMMTMMMMMTMGVVFAFFFSELSLLLFPWADLVRCQMVQADTDFRLGFYHLGSSVLL